ncbi:MAG TPA: MerC domain-containing protein [Thermoanaerobaculia bacterium]
MNARDHADKVGILGAAFAALCCLGISAVLSVVSAIGLGFLIHDAVLLPLLILSLLVTLWGLYSGWKRHGRAAALALGGTAAVVLLMTSFIHQSRPLALASIAALAGASVLNVVFARA